MNPAPTVSLPQFDGPLDLLLELVRKNEIDITDLPIATITRQYLDYLHRAEELDLHLGSEFAYVAALLIHIKSRCLLKTDPEITAPEEDPRQELVRLLLDHDQVRQGAEFLKQQLDLAEASWSKSSMGDFEDPPEAPPESNGALNLLQVLRIAKQALEAARTYEIITPADPVSIDEMIGWLAGRLQGRVDAQALLKEQPDSQRRSTLFLAMLEMARCSRIQLDQRQCFGPIYIAEVGVRNG